MSIKRSENVLINLRVRTPKRCSVYITRNYSRITSRSRHMAQNRKKSIDMFLHMIERSQGYNFVQHIYIGHICNRKKKCQRCSSCTYVPTHHREISVQDLHRLVERLGFLFRGLPVLSSNTKRLLRNEVWEKKRKYQARQYSKPFAEIRKKILNVLHSSGTLNTVLT